MLFDCSLSMPTSPRGPRLPNSPRRSPVVELEAASVTVVAESMEEDLGESEEGGDPLTDQSVDLNEVEEGQVHGVDSGEDFDFDNNNSM